ncbi:DUF1636 family protein [Celeribacter indicus]|uniref:Metal-binding protein n=1 Tax=Celeribacter indicus TaxID=1208324 RepID=A0A0B5DQ16_9RHOB|nr:DUF1636 domain-containing protein [Celeribacter indicus]AJE45209.1 hypothetical protein P73_0494 [Celeribacter indicus]SDX45364.1 Predicted metal-binding protein [Celeribacter indicus]
MGGVTLMICQTCRRVAGGPPETEEPRPGARLLGRLEAACLPDTVTIRPVACLSACTRGCTIALSGGPKRWSYIYGDLDPDRHVEAILEGAARYAASEDGRVPWRERPEIFRKQSIARLPPQD